MSRAAAPEFTKRRIRNLTITLASTVLLLTVFYSQNQSLGHASFTSGYLLYGTLLFLTLLNLRKRLSFLPAIGSAKFWMQVHIYVGLATFAIFASHIGWRIPNGKLEVFLAALYLIVAFSGVYGLYATRVYPKRLTRIGTEVIFERIPQLRNQLALHARQLVIETCESSDVLAKFYTSRLCYFFEQQPALAYLVHPSSRTRKKLIHEMEDLDRYLGTDQRQVREKLTQMVHQKDDLDYHQALQGRLKIWLFVHIGLTYSLLLVGLLHGILAHAFSGGPS
ncbi:MAG: hypothetical protein AAF623_01040 [Planctomycetota bacterium]